MVRSRLILLIVAAIAVVVEAQPNYILNLISILLGPLLDVLVRGTCRAIFNNFDDGFRLGCRCRGVYQDYFGGIGGKITCQIDDPFCLINRPFQLYCGEVDVTATFNTREGISKIKGCIDITSHFPKNFPIPLDEISEFPKACVSVFPADDEFLTFESCEITFDKELCQSCTVCESGRDFLFDCRNININPAQDVEDTFIEGPFVTECIGFSFLFGIVPPSPPPISTTPPFMAPLNPPTQGAPTIINMPVSPVAIPVVPSVSVPVPAPVTNPVSPPVTSPVVTPVAAAPVNPPMTSPVSTPVAAPVNPPMTSPVSSPVASAPVTAPVKAPVAP